MVTILRVYTLYLTTSGLSKLFDVQNRRFTTITCTKCKYTEMYKGTTSDLENIFDFLIGG